jgi:uncharacterized protein
MDDGDGASPDIEPSVILTAAERRVLGCLIEKERTTPQGYPLTLNSLRSACNQTTNRDPVTAYREAEVDDALSSLRSRELIRIVYSMSNRAAKYRHVLAETWRLDDAELAVLAILLLRGPQTLGEIKTRTERLTTDLPDLPTVSATLTRLAERPAGPLAVLLARRPGQKEARWTHLLGPVDEVASEGERAMAGDHSLSGQVPPSADVPVADPVLVAELAAEVTRLRADVDALRAEIRALRADLGEPPEGGD